METATICRCCLAKGVHKDLNTPYVWMDKTEIYGDMLLDCFNIYLTPALSNSICEKCVLSLRSSVVFKQRVLEADKEFLRKFEGMEENAKIEVKVERENADSDGATSDDYFLADAVSVKQEFDPSVAVKEEPMKKQHKHKAKTKNDQKMRFQKQNVNSTKEDKSKKIKQLVNKLASLSNLPGITVTKKTSIPNKKKSSLTKIPNGEIVKNPTNTIKLEFSDLSTKLKDKHMNNLNALLTYSNVVPFKGKTELGYICGYCDKSYPDPKDLRTHNTTEHKNDTKLYLKWECNAYMVKMDITDLQCNLCNDSIEDLKALREHLSIVHGKIIYNDIQDHFVQYKLNKGDVYNCSMCTAQYETFKSLTQHMNNHYRNFDCPDCDRSFATKRSLVVHSSTHKEGVFKCSLCDKVFSTLVKKRYHERSLHEKRKRIAPCPFCQMEFTNYYNKNVHLSKFHNVEPKYKCNVCFKTFIIKNLLMQHVKKQHLMEKNVVCSVCGHKFFSSKGLKNHMLKHTGEKNYKCHVCNKAYGRKYTLTEHLRIHNNDRRFQCDVCAMSFVQKCSLKSHLLSNHGISLAASEISAVDGQKSVIESDGSIISPS